jgi:ammonia channel protein AmtB
MGVAMIIFMVVQASGLSLLFGGIYIRKGMTPLLWPSLLMHAAGGIGLTITGIWLMFKLIRTARGMRTGMLIKDEESQIPQKDAENSGIF